ncbi:hypothetical protein LHU53_18975 [Rhodoferax sp. U2-2l]|uniref:hypothetical protein n=1 Tax=Rhodoferax sp. U2-2l TaxID=2884000 RepID=UPI001D0B39DB|nr:hypothetical protein [Rhodoferax sp. U2-2l]MCB8748976.1 hypothetical protein [Rhodoferax sp. U2-2l]
MNILKAALVHTRIWFMLLALTGATSNTPSYADELQPGNTYKIVGPVYLAGIFKNLNNRQLERGLAVESLTAVQFKGPEVAFQRKMPQGTTMTIIGPAPKRVPLPFYANRYFVRLDPKDPPSELDVILELNRGIEGSLDGLNPELFSRVLTQESN